MNQQVRKYLVGLDYGTKFSEMVIKADSESNARKATWATLTDGQKDNLASMEILDEQDDSGNWVLCPTARISP